ncbi:flagellar filament capping protein FliD [Thiomicrorhabdus lithotrophica]|uniref:Flagellar hook-associated protein 2 n=1 Tax=Thiomicrorhabdus lithotrophica TaxID=2949997 RepID=A0ABY8CD08_9GAMM|nr:flagellar filament capping protein FliD [Thiomicrorhabdus lithotrophica]WEJ63372.1 flagellar filament capping protein FliD [Thiomicrorhabdus lithotrophica]
MNEIGNTLLNSLTNSTFDIGNMSKALAEAEVAGPRAIIERNQDKASTEVDAFAYLELNLNAFKSYVTDLSNPETFLSKSASSSNESVVSVTANNSVSEGSYQIESKQMALFHTQVANKSFASPYETLSTGTLDITVGGQVQSITVDASNNTVEGLQKYINNGDYGVNASVINNGGSYQLMFTSKQQGSAGEVSISGLTEFDTEGLTTTAEAQDAVMVINGLSVSNSSNTFDDVIEGLSFKLNSVSIGQTNTVSISNDTEAAVESIKSFVDVYNQLDTILDEISSYDTSDLTDEQLDSEEYQYYGDLAGNSSLKQVRSSITEALSGAIDEISGNYNSLISIGIKRTLDGELELDESVLNDIAVNNFEALSGLFAKGGSSDDGQINFLSSTENTITGGYQLDITQLAERASVTGNLATVSSDERVSGDRVTDPTAVLSVESGASLDVTIGGVNQSIDLSALANTYSSKDEVALAIQGALDTAFGGSVATFNYDVSQSRFELSANAGQGAVVINSATGLSNQGFDIGKTYSGEGLITLGASSFDIKVDDAEVTSINLAGDRYTLSELARVMTESINNNTTVKESGNSVTVSENAGALTMASNRFGGFSKVELTNISASLADSGFSADISDAGQSVDGTITTASGTLNVGAYADSLDGRIINISDFAIINGEAAEVRGLKFEVLGGQYDGGGALITDRGELNFAKGFGSRLEDAITGFFDEDTGIIARRVDSLSEKLEIYKEKATDLDARYEKLELKYQMQFSMLQALLSSSEATRNQLAAQFSNNNN